MAETDFDRNGINVTEAYTEGLEKLKEFFLPLMLVALAVVASSLVATVFEQILPGVVGAVVQVVIVGPISFGAAYTMLGAVRGEKPSVEDLVVPYRRCFLQSMIAYVLLLFSLTIGFYLLVLPGVFLATRLAFVPYLVVDEDLDAISAFRESWRRTGPFAWSILGAILLSLPIAAVGLLLLVVGILPAISWVGLSFAVLFHDATNAIGRAVPVRSTVG